MNQNKRDYGFANPSVVSHVDADSLFKGADALAAKALLCYLDDCIEEGGCDPEFAEELDRARRELSQYYGWDDSVLQGRRKERKKA